MSQNVVTIVAGKYTETANLGIMKAGDTGIGALSISDTTASSNSATGSFITSGGIGVSKESYFGKQICINYPGGTTTPVLICANSTQVSTPSLGSSYGHIAFLTGSTTGTYGIIIGTMGTGSTWIQSQRIDTNTSTYNIYLNPSGGKVGVGTATVAETLTVGGSISATTVKATTVGGYISSDGSTGYTGTVTTASLVGKTLTIKDGIITGFA